MRMTGGRKVTIKRVEQTTDGQGGFIKNRVVVATDRARVSTKSVSERLSADQEQGRVTHTAFMRGGADIRVDDEIYVGSMDLTLTVKGVNNPALAGEELQIDCEQIQADQ